MKKIRLEVLKSAVGLSVYLNDRRISGNKVLPFSDTLLNVKIEIEDLKKIITDFELDKENK